MFQKNIICVEAEHIDETVIPTIPDSTLFGPTVKSESSGPAGGAAMADSPAEQTACVAAHCQDSVTERLCAFLSDRVSERVTLKELSCFLGYSEKYASDVFQRYMGLPFSKHLKQLRLDKATSMLLEERHTITKIAESVGFSDAFAFSHFFKRAVGCSPTEYRRQQLRQADMA